MGEKLGGECSSGSCGNIFDIKVSPDISEDVVIEGFVNGKNTGSMDSNKFTKLVNDIPGSTSGNLIVKINGDEYLLIDDLSTIATEIYKPEILNTKIKLISNKYGAPTLKKLRRKYVKSNVGDSFVKEYGGKTPIIMIGIAEVVLFGFVYKRLAGVMKVKITADIDVYDRTGKSTTWVVVLSGNLAAADVLSGLSIGISHFYTSLKGPAIRRPEDISLAFEDSVFKTCGVTLQYGAGVTTGSLSIGNYVSGEGIVETTGIGNTFGCLAGKLKIDKQYQK